MDMRFEDLQIFVTISEMNSMTKASDYLHLTKQTITTRIKLLEEELGKQLFFRSRKGCFLTDEGLEVFTTAKKILNLTDSLYYKNSDKKSNGDYFFKINFMVQPSFSYYYNTLVDTIHQKYQKNSIYINSTDAFFINNQIRSNKIDDYVIMTTFTEEQLFTYKDVLENYNWYILYKSRLKLITAQSSPLAMKKQISIYSLKKYPMIFYSSNNNQEETFHSNLLKSFGVEIESKLLSNNEEIIVKNVLENSLYTLSTDRTYKNIDFSDKLKFVNITPRIEIYYVVLFPKNSTKEIDICKELFLNIFGANLFKKNLS